jgi:hypothetical protein
LRYSACARYEGLGVLFTLSGTNFVARHRSSHQRAPPLHEVLDSRGGASGDRWNNCRDVLSKTVFGPDYIEGGGPFSLLLSNIGLIFIHSALRNLLIVAEHMKTDMRIVGVAAGLNVASNLVVIPRYGLLGRLLHRRVRLKPCVWPHSDWQPWHATESFDGGATAYGRGIMGADLLALGNRPLAVLLCLGAVVYAGVLAAVRGIPQDAQPYLNALACWIRKFLCGKNDDNAMRIRE